MTEIEKLEELRSYYQSILDDLDEPLSKYDLRTRIDTVEKCINAIR